MADSPTLADLNIFELIAIGGEHGGGYRPATREDILTVIRELGGVEADSIRTWPEHKDDGEFIHYMDSVEVVRPDRYLIIPLDES